MDPRVWLFGGFLVFGGIVAFAEISQRLEKKQKPVAPTEDTDEPDAP